MGGNGLGGNEDAQTTGLLLPLQAAFVRLGCSPEQIGGTLLPEVPVPRRQPRQQRRQVRKLPCDEVCHTFLVLPLPVDRQQP